MLQEPAALTLPWDLRLTPEQFALVCAANPDVVLELAADGRLIPMTSTGGDTGARNNALLFQLNLALDQAAARQIQQPSMLTLL